MHLDQFVKSRKVHLLSASVVDLDLLSFTAVNIIKAYGTCNVDYGSFKKHKLLLSHFSHTKYIQFYADLYQNLVVYSPLFKFLFSEI